MKLNQRLIEQLRDGEVVMKADGTEDQCDKITQEAFGESSSSLYPYYFKSNIMEGYDFSDIAPEGKKIISVKEFFKTEEMDKEIIKYKLKDPKFNQACKDITGMDFDYVNGDAVRPNSVVGKGTPTKSYRLLKEAGVLDLWFEPVYKETQPEVNKWYKNSLSSIGDSIFYATEFHKRTGTFSGYGVEAVTWRNENKSYWSDENLEPATDEEVRSLLKKEAIKRGFVQGAKFKFGDTIRTIRDNDLQIYLSKNTVHVSTPQEEWGKTGYSNPKIFGNGEWAEIVEEAELPKINGYEGEILGNTLSYGCARIPIKFFDDVVGNRSIKELTLDSGVTINEEQINQIREYLKNR